MSAAFDGSGYRRRVLAPLRARPELDTADGFLIADLDPTVEHTDADVAARLARVIAFLQRERNSAKYAALAAELVRRRAEWEMPLLDAETREELRRRVLETRRDTDAERLAKVDGYLATVRDRFGGIPASRVVGLRRLAAAAGVTGEEFDARLAGERIIPDTAGSGAEPLPAEVRRQIRDRLDELRSLRGGDRVTTGSLWTFLELSPDVSADRIRAAYEATSAANARRPHDREKTVTADLLAFVRARLVDGDPVAYTAGLIADAADELRPAVEEHVVLDGELTATAYEGLLRTAIASGRGLTAEQARIAILGIARDLGAPVSVGGVVDYVLCPGCGRPEPAGASRTCRYCDTELYASCASCGAMTEVAVVSCRRCGHSLRQARAAREALAAVRHALDEGRPRQANETLARARAAIAAGDLGAARAPDRPLADARNPPGSASAERPMTEPPSAALRPYPSARPVAAADELSARVWAALGAAEAGWRALAEERAAGRTDAAVERARWLVAHAADVTGPDGRTAADVLGELVAEQAVIRRRVDAARSLPPDAQEAALVAVLATAADNGDALRALAALPLPPPRDLTTSLVDDAVLLRWRPSPSVGPVSYRVERIFSDPRSGAPVRLSLGTTQATELADAGAPAWTPVRHEVTALSGVRRSVPVLTTPVVPIRDVVDLRAERTTSGIRLTWRTDGASDLVTIERTVDPDLSAEGPPRRARVAGGTLLDPDARAETGYRYRAFIEYVDAGGRAARTTGAEVGCDPAGSPRAVGDLTASSEGGVTTLRWSPPGAEVRVYAVAVPPSRSWVETGAQTGALRIGPGRATSPAPLAVLGPEGGDLALSSIVPPVRLVGGSWQGWLREAAAPGEVLYIPVTVHGDRGVVGRAIRHVAMTVVPPAPTEPASEFGDLRSAVDAVGAATNAANPVSPMNPAAGRSAATGALPVPGIHPATGALPIAAWQPAPVPIGPPDVPAVVPSDPSDGAPVGTGALPAPAVQGPSTPTTVSYTVAKAGWRRRTLRIQVRADGPVPDLVLIARSGDVPPTATADGHLLSGLPAAMEATTRTIDVPLEGAQLPWGVRLLPSTALPARTDPAVRMDHPPDTTLIVR